MGGMESEKAKWTGYTHDGRISECLPRDDDLVRMWQEKNLEFFFAFVIQIRCLENDLTKYEAS